MCLKIRCDGKSEKFCKIFCEVNKAQEKSSESSEACQYLCYTSMSVDVEGITKAKER